MSQFPFSFSVQPPGNLSSSICFRGCQAKGSKIPQFLTDTLSYITTVIPCISMHGQCATECNGAECHDSHKLSPNSDFESNFAPLQHCPSGHSKGWGKPDKPFRALWWHQTRACISSALVAPWNARVGISGNLQTPEQTRHWGSSEQPFRFDERQMSLWCCKNRHFRCRRTKNTARSPRPCAVLVRQILI